MTRLCILLLSACILAGCVSLPTNPTILALPGRDRTYTQFQQDQVYCRTMAQQQQAQSPESLQAESTAKSAVVTGLIGAAAGAIIGGVTGSPGTGAAIGGASGGVLGAAGGAGSARQAAEVMQRQYDHAYASCMYAQGNQVPSIPLMSR